MNTETIDTLKELLVPVAEKIGQTAEWGWEVVLKQMYVEAGIGLVTAIIASIVVVPYYKKIKDDRELELIHLLIIGMGTIAIFLGLHTAITHFINPEFYAIEFFINLVK